MNLVSDLTAVLAKYARHLEIYWYSLVGTNGASLLGADNMSLASNALVSLSPAVVSLVHAIVNDLGAPAKSVAQDSDTVA